MSAKESEKKEWSKPLRKKTDKPLILPKSLADKQRIHLEKLMSDPEKPVYIPEKKKQWTPRSAPEFVRDVMGSSAGAGSGEFHVYRGYRRREMARQTYLDAMQGKDEKDSEFQESLQRKKLEAETKTAKKRAKRERRKQKLKAKKMKQEEEEKVIKSDSEGNEKDEDRVDDADVNCFVIGGK